MFFYGLRSSAFDREFRSVYEGVKHYNQSLKEIGGNEVLLRRNTHRLEKGLLMRPRRDLFALEYICETVDCYAILVAKGSISPEDRAWSGDVLREYFRITGVHEVIEEARSKFELIKEPTCSSRESLIPYHRDLSELSVDFDALRKLAIRRRSVRWFLPKPVPRELMYKAMEVASQSPSACNRQPFIFRAFDEPGMVRKIVSIPYGTVGFGDNIPTIIVVVGQLHDFWDERDRHLIYIDGALAGMSFVFAAETLGLSTCIINWPDLADKEKQMSELLHLEPDERPVFLIAVGYPDPDGLVARSAKKPIHELLIFDNK